MIEPLLALPPHARRRLSGALAAGALPLTCTATALRSALGNVEGLDAAVAALAALARAGVPPVAAAEWVRSLDRVAGHVRAPELVCSGPEIPGHHARDTRRVYEELLGSAERSLWISTFAFFDGPRAFEFVARRMEERTALRVTLLLNIQRRPRNTTAADHLVRAFADQFWKRDWPGSRRPAVYYDPRSLEEGGPTGVLHAKGVVADEETLFLTSANLTEAALDRNVELGLLVRDRQLAATVAQRFQALIDRAVLAALPGE
ncbi:MAG: hypothetical protein HMLKMBBP_01369 [Planctomycetes bacterium]|nr:hypothetical protein [Planctomycetota bacterium]